MDGYSNCYCRNTLRARRACWEAFDSFGLLGHLLGLPGTSRWFEHQCRSDLDSCTHAPHAGWIQRGLGFRLDLSIVPSSRAKQVRTAIHQCISADLAWIPALLHAYSVTHYVPAGYNEASGSFCPLGHLLGLPGTRPPSISADPDFVSCTHTRCPITCPLDTMRLLARFVRWAICSGCRVRDRRPSVPT